MKIIITESQLKLLLQVAPSYEFKWNDFTSPQLDMMAFMGDKVFSLLKKNITNYSDTIELSSRDEETIKKEKENLKWSIDNRIININNRKIKEVIYKKDATGNLFKDKAGNPIVLRTVSKSIVYTLPNQKIKVIFRLDNSGTTNNFVRYMKAFAPNTWTKPVSDSFSTSFPNNINDVNNLGRVSGANQSQGVATLASKTKYSITYAEVSFAKFFNLKVANIGNASGNFVEPNSANVSAFLGEASIDSNNILSYDYATKEPGAYPLGIVSYLLADTAGKNKASVKEWAKYLVSPECVSAKPELGFALITGKFLEFVNKQINRL